MSYFILVKIPNGDIEVLRKATEKEKNWYNGLSNRLKEYWDNANRFDRVDKSYSELILATESKGKILDVEEMVKYRSANFLYSFRECIDHWETYINRKYGKSSNYYKKYKTLTYKVYDEYDEYKITYFLRNYQHVDDAVHFVNYVNGKVRPYIDRDIVLKEKKLKGDIRTAIKSRSKIIDLLPMFEIAKNEFGSVHVKLIFYTVTPELESQVEEALDFKNSISKNMMDSVILGDFVDSAGNIIEPNNQSFNNIWLNDFRFSLNYIEIPWGTCNLIKRFKGTDYKNI